MASAFHLCKTALLSLYITGSAIWGSRMSLSTTTDTVFEVLEGQTELEFPLLLGMAACVDGGTSLTTYSGLQTLRKTAHHLRLDKHAAKNLLSLIHFAKWQSVLSLSQAVKKDHSSENLQDLNEIIKIAKQQIKQPEYRQKKGVLDKLLKRQNVSASSAKLTQTEAAIETHLNEFLNADAENIDAISLAISQYVWNDIFTVFGTLNPDTERPLGVPQLRERFFDPANGWAVQFRILLKARLDKSQDHTRHVLLALGSDNLKMAMTTQNLIRGLAGPLEALAENQTDILSVLKPSLRLTGGSTTTANKTSPFVDMTYKEQLTEFVGRENERQALRVFMQDERPLLWWQVAGDAGQGKSRIALELIQEFEEDWHAGFISARDLPERWDNIQFERPTLIVIDYISNQEKAEKTADGLITLYERNEINQPIRILLVERSPYSFSGSGPSQSLWFKSFRDRRQPEIIANTVFTTEKPLLLGPLLKDDMIKIANSWRDHRALCSLSDEQKQTLLTKLGYDGESITKDRAWRPLLAMIYSEIIDQTEKLPLKDVLAQILDDERASYWKDGSGSEIVPSDAAINLACLTTMLGELFLDDLKEEDAIALDIYSDITVRQTWMVLGFQQNPEADQNRKLLAREPDLLGEYMVCQYIKAFNPSRFKEILDIAWRIDKKALIQFVNRLFEDQQDLEIARIYKRIAQHGYDVKGITQDQERNALFVISCGLGLQTLALELLSTFSESQVRDLSGISLLLAAQEGHSAIVALLLEQDGIDVNQQNPSNGTFALLMAAQNGHTEIVASLLEQDGIDVNQQNPNSGTFALLQAAQNGHAAIVALLLEQDGIDVHLEEYKIGMSAIQIAVMGGHYEVAELLHKTGASIPNEQSLLNLVQKIEDFMRDNPQTPHE